MSVISLDQVSKIYPGGARALTDVSLTVEEGEFLVLFGPPGCGKSTLLRTVAGLEEITSGELLIKGEYANDVPTKERDVAMYFQGASLSPNATVGENLAYGLRLRKVPEELIARRVKAMAELLGLKDLNKKPKQLATNERLRVAVGRAVVREPAVFLLDEPFSNLDGGNRELAVRELLALEARLRIPFVYATESAREAMSLGTRIAVLREGSVRQIASPEEIYRDPVCVFVADLLSRMTLVRGILREGKVAGETPLPEHLSKAAEGYEGREVVLGYHADEGLGSAVLFDGESELSLVHEGKLPVPIKELRARAGGKTARRKK